MAKAVAFVYSIRVRDRLSKERRSWNMSRIRGKNTAPEIRVRSLLHRLGYRFRLHGKKLPGRPDVVLVKYKTVVFIHGCFWHRHRGCKNCTTPTNRREWWLAKLNGNAVRDKLHKRALRKLGWQSIVVWECQTENPKSLEQLVAAFTRRKLPPVQPGVQSLPANVRASGRTSPTTVRRTRTTRHRHARRHASAAKRLSTRGQTTGGIRALVC